MPRNEAKPLSLADARRQRVNQRVLEGLSEVTVRYTKRNGQESSSTGKVAYFNGQIGMDTGSVTIDTPDKGPRTINLHSIHTIE
jgi:hypothetical protein